MLCTNRLLALEKGAELLDVAFAHSSEEVEPVGVVRSDGRYNRRRDHQVGQSSRTAERVRAAPPE